MGAGLGSGCHLQGCYLQAPGTSSEGREGNLRAAMMVKKVGPGRCYLEPGSSDAPVELVILTAPAPEAVGHPVALTETGSIICPILPGCSLVYYQSTQPKLGRALFPGSLGQTHPEIYSSHNLCSIRGIVGTSQSLCLFLWGLELV